MRITPIFTKKAEGRLWAVCSIQGKKSSDVFSDLVKQLTDTQFLFDFFTNHLADLNDPFWEGITADEAIDKVIEEINDLELELYSIENNLPGYENRSLSDIFIALHQNMYSISFKNERLRKVKPAFQKPMVRVYAIELDDGTFVITGGTIKLPKEMKGENFDQELEKLEKLRNFLHNENIRDKEALKDLLNE